MNRQKKRVNGGERDEFLFDFLSSNIFQASRSVWIFQYIPSRSLKRLYVFYCQLSENHQIGVVERGMNHETIK